MFTLGLKCFRHRQVAAAVSTLTSAACCSVQTPTIGLSSLCKRGYATVKQLLYPPALSVYLPRRHFVFVTHRDHVSSPVFKSRTLNIATRHMAKKTVDQKNTSALIYIVATGIFMCGMGYAAVPLYRMFCQATGLGGQAIKGHDTTKVETMKPVKDRQITVRFNADTESRMQWKFMPHQPEVKLVPGETALAFYSAKNPTDRPIIGISTYNVVPFDAGQYFNKIQCFCFEEQRLNPHEEVDMPVFFYIDPEFNDDPKMERVHTITLSYTFFEASEGMTLPLPGYVTPQPQPVT